MSQLRICAFRATAALLAATLFVSTAHAAVPPWTEKTIDGVSYALFTLEQTKLLLRADLDLHDAESRVHILEEKLRLSEESLLLLEPVVQDLVVQVTASNHKLAEITQEIIRQDDGRLDMWTLAASIFGAALVGSALTLLLRRD